MIIADLSVGDLHGLACTTGIRYQTGCFTACLHTDNRQLIETFRLIYPHNPLLNGNTLCQYHVTIGRPKGLRRWIRPKALFSIDGHWPFDPYPLDHAFPMLEWGLNWCIGTTANQYLLLHSAVVEKNGCALVLPAVPGSGKSTLCCGLVSSGWRLLSDEFGVVAPGARELLPLPRAVPLKNESIEVIRQFAPEATLGPVYEKTRKGLVCHFAPPQDSIIRQGETAKPRWIVFPVYQQGIKTRLFADDKSVAFTRLSNNSFNYQLTMEQGFCSLAALVREADCYRLDSGDLLESVNLLNELAEGGVFE